MIELSRIAQFVGHGRQEGGLEPVRRLRLLHRCAQFLGPLYHTRFQCCAVFLHLPEKLGVVDGYGDLCGHCFQQALVGRVECAGEFRFHIDDADGAVVHTQWHTHLGADIIAHGHVARIRTHVVGAR